MARSKKSLMTTPVGTFIYPHLNTPDTKFDSDGVYTVKIRPDDPAENAAFRKLIDKLMKMSAKGESMDARTKKGYDKAVAKLEEGESLKIADAPYSKDEDDPKLFVFNFKMKAKGTTREGETFTRTPKLFDAQGNPCPDARIGGGTKGRVSFDVYHFFTALIGAGVSLRLEAAQIIDLVEWGGRNAEGFGFEAVDGFSIEDAGDNFEVGTEDLEAINTAFESLGDVDENDSYDF